MQSPKTESADELSEGSKAEAGNASQLQTKITDALCRLTPELSRPVAGRRTGASVARAPG
jgi:hypothetical protein